MEIERKFLPSQLPEGLSTLRSIPMVQGYLCTEPVIRVRREGPRCILTYKGKGLLAREEYNLPLSEKAFLHLLPKCDGRLIQKTRYLLPLKGTALTAEIDLFEGELAGLVLLEVEFPSMEAAECFVPPAWFGREVTQDPAYHNANLSRGVDPRSAG